MLVFYSRVLESELAQANSWSLAMSLELAFKNLEELARKMKSLHVENEFFLETEFSDSIQCIDTFFNFLQKSMRKFCCLHVKSSFFSSVVCFIFSEWERERMGDIRPRISARSGPHLFKSDPWGPSLSKSPLFTGFCPMREWFWGS